MKTPVSPKKPARSIAKAPIKTIRNPISMADVEAVAARLKRPARVPRNVRSATSDPLSYWHDRLKRMNEEGPRANPWVLDPTEDIFSDAEAPQVDLVAPPVLVAPPAPAEFTPAQAPTYSDREINHVEHLLLADLPSKPVFRMGIEFEGLIRKEVYEDFKDAMVHLGYDEESSENLISFGYDDSIRDYPGGYEPVEIRTQTVRSKTGIRLLEEMLCFLYLASQTGDWLTNHSCGFHINISEDAVWQADKAVEYYAHVLSHFDEGAVLARFGRLGTAHGSKYCKPFFGADDSREVESIIHQYRLCKRREKAAKERGDNLNQHAKESKYYAVSLRDSPAHDDFNGEDALATRIEFRCIGNESYHLKLDDLEESINHMISVVRLAFRDTMA